MLTKKAVENGSNDNITVLVLKLNWLLIIDRIAI